MIRKSPLSVAISTTLALAASGLSTAAYAQDAELEEVVVTGSRIARSDGFAAVAPVSVVSSEDIRATGLTRMEDVMNSLPSVEAAQNSFISNGATGTASVDLRGIGANRTLVLFNGKRLQPGGVNTQIPDINQIPAAIVERVEVLTGGASATYGADAVAGVVNFITRKVNGVEISMGASSYYHQNGNDYLRGLMDDRNFDYPIGGDVDGTAYNIDIVMGSDFADGRGNATVYGTWRKSDPLLQGARDYSSCALNSAGTGCGGSATSPNPNYFIAPLVDGEYDYNQEGFFTLAPDGSLVDFYDNPAGENYYNFAPVNYFMRPETRYTLGAFVDYEINENFKPYLEVNYANSDTRSQIAESGTFFVEWYPVPLNSSLFPQAFRDSLVDIYGADYDEYGVYVGKRNKEGGPRSELITQDSFRAVVGTKGQLTENWDYDLFYQYAGTSSSSTYINDLNLDLIRAALGPDCASTAGGCYQVFTPGGVTSTQASALSGTAIATGETSTEVIGGYVTGDLGFGLPGASPIQAVVGFEHRTETYERIADSIYQAGSLAGQGGPTLNLAGHYNVMEYFAEANVPLLEGVTFAESLNLDLAYRYSDYSTVGTTDTYRFGLDWKPVEMLRVRTGFNRAVRAPNVAELFDGERIALWSGTDPCANQRGTGVPIYTEAECANTGVLPGQYGNITRSPASQYNQFISGNQGLDPESADTITAGIVVTPLSNLTISIDYWSIEIEDAINTLDAPLILEVCAKANQLCDFVQRAPNGSLWQGQAGFVVNPTDNWGKESYEGIDLAGTWTLDALSGQFSTSLIGTYMLTKEIDPLPSYPEASYDCVGLISSVCFPTPEWRHTLTVGYDSNEWWAVGAKWRYFGGVDYEEGVDQIAAGELDGAQNYFDINATFRFLENSDFVVGVNNVLDEEPPMMGSTLSTNANTVAGYYDTLGMFLFANVTFRF